MLPREAELAQSYGVSRQAVREALKVLAAKGMLTTRRRAGSRVSPRSLWNLLDPDVLAWHAIVGLRPEFLRDLVEFRALVEPNTAALAARRASPDQLERIVGTAEAMRAAVDDCDRFHDADVAFHAAVFAASGNALIDRLSTIVEPVLQVSSTVQSSASERTAWAGDHERVATAIANHDADGAEAAMRYVVDMYNGEVSTDERGRVSADAAVVWKTSDASLLYPSGALHGQLAHQIGEQIVSGTLGEGVTLPRESELALKYKVSRQAVREALKVLAAKGLVSTRRRAGTTVTARENWNLLDHDVIAWHNPKDLSFQFLIDLIELRQLVEPPSAALAAARRSPAQMARISSAMSEMRRTAAESNWVDADVEFHMAVAAASGNAILVSLSRILAPVLEASMKGQGNLAPTLEVALEVHAAIEQGIVAADPERAGAAMAAMLSLTDSRLHEAVGLGKQRSA
ncbi:DNA-binding transcriptional regulator, FadR family [Bauldia litoralis]|uniref:DNA-binding transcriptional regulator, FadR family n=1 Tax=Bauldia litoralis TaxID=665467 RepID=A0A1G6CC47_9HYPH|nr:DNA-binding transcriptional regulator, FadR family [Bauldia litoralis]